MSGSALRGAVVGCGFFSVNHLNAWRDLGEVSIVAVCDRDEAKAAAAAAAFGITAVFTDMHAMLQRERPDFVDIITTAPTHRKLVEIAAASGTAVICQKPFAETMADAEAMVSACRAAGVPLMVHENFRWQSALLEVKRLVGSGAIGASQHARIVFRHAFDIYSGQPYLRREERLALMDIGVHVLDVARDLMGEVTRLYCRTQRVRPGLAGEDAATLLLDHAGGAVTSVEISFATVLDPDPFPQTLVTVAGSQGTVSLDVGYRLTLVRAGSHDVRDVEPPVPSWGAKPWHVIQDSVINIQRDWLECLRSGREPATSGADNLRTLDLVFKAYESAASGQAITIGEG